MWHFFAVLAQVWVYPLTTSIWRQHVACESGATCYKFTRVFSIFSTSTFLLPPTLPFLVPSPSLPASTRNEGHTDCWLRQQVHNAGWPHIFACVVSSKSFFLLFIFHFSLVFFTACLAMLASVTAATPTPWPQSHKLWEGFPAAICTTVHTRFYLTTTGTGHYYADLM